MRSLIGYTIENLLLPMGDLVTGQRMIKRYHFLKKAQWWDRKKLLEYRNQLLRATFDTAITEVPFYKKLYSNAGVRAGDIRSPEDLCMLPFVTKDMIRPNYPDLMTRKTGSKTFERVTSGSTGKNFVSLLDKDVYGILAASFMLALNWAGWSIGEPHFQTGMTLRRSPAKKLKDILLRCSYSSAYDLSNRVLDEYLARIERKNIKHVWGYPGSIYYLAKRASELGWNRPMKSVATWGDTLDPSSRRLIESTFKQRVSDTYGCAEGIQVAAQCGTGDAYHIHSLDVVVEIIDDEGRPVPPGRMGNILLTRLHPGPMPLIRYRVGDRGILGTGECACGRSFEILEAVRGREPDQIVTPSGNRLIVHFFTGILEHFKEIDCFQVVQDKLDSLTIKIVPHEQLSTETKEGIIYHIREKGAKDMNIRVELVEDIPLDITGKRKFIISQHSN